MARNTRLAVLLAVLVIVALVALFRPAGTLQPGAPPSPAPGVPGAQATSGSAGQRGAAAGMLPEVKLKALAGVRPVPAERHRNPFRMDAPPPPPPGPAGPRPADQQPGSPIGGPLPAPTLEVPPIPLKFIGIVNLPGQQGKLAVLSDGRFVYHGREGEIIDGRYRIARIGEESVDMEYADGRGRQRIRLSGS